MVNKKVVIIVLSYIMCLSLLTNILAIANIDIPASERAKPADYLRCSNPCISQWKTQSQYCRVYYDSSVSYCRQSFNECKASTYSSLSDCKMYFTECNMYNSNSKTYCEKSANNQLETCKYECRLAKCPKTYDPVCGMDDKTYNNTCVMRKAGVQLNYYGKCVHYCFDNSQCNQGEYCQNIDGMCYNVPINYDQINNLKCLTPFQKGSAISVSNSDMFGCVLWIGTCTRVPQICTMEYNPVCGCDNKTYSNYCAMQGAKVSLAYYGECNAIVPVK